MNVSSAASIASSLSQARVADAVSTLVLKKALALQAQQAAQLIAALPQTAPSAPAHLGQNIDVRV
ncbi:putative motility protein [Zoogloeaceae bacteirum Par-f-2]|nr:putative motility protein [Zoogloeaceae bacteirum Par-f-2]